MDSQTKQDVFVALMLPPDLSDRAEALHQQLVATHPQLKRLRTPPHITLVPPFAVTGKTVQHLEQRLQAVAGDRPPCPVSVKGFGGFAPRVVYIEVLKTPELLDLQRRLTLDLQQVLHLPDRDAGKGRSFSPHITIAKQLKGKEYGAILNHLEEYHLEVAFCADRLTLLVFQEYRWQIYRSFPFASP